MSNSNNIDPLEKLFQRKAEEYDISYREEDWNDLNDRLDARDAKRTARKKRWLAAAVVLIVFSVLGYFTYQNYQKINALNEQLSQTEETVTPQSSVGNKESQQPESEKTNPDNPNNEELATNPPVENKNTESNTPSRQDPEAPVTDESKKQSSQMMAQNMAGQLGISQIDCEQCQLSSLAVADVMDWSMIKKAGSRKNETNLAAIPQEKSQDNPIVARSTTTQPITTQRNIPKTTVGLVLGPDLSTAGSLSDFYNPGSKIGITLDYNLSSNWGISIGAIRSNVRYKASGKEYQLPQTYASYGVQSAGTTAQCILIDIPINVNYRFLHFNHSRMYASAGFSSYIMLNEKYRFKYSSNQTGQPTRWQQDTGTVHFMSNASFSVGYELDISRNLSLRAEPFIRVPLKEIGMANVNLYSVGSLFSLNYHFK